MGWGLLMLMLVFSYFSRSAMKPHIHKLVEGSTQHNQKLLLLILLQYIHMTVREFYQFVHI